MSSCTPSAKHPGHGRLAPGDLVNLIDENDAHLLGALHGETRHLSISISLFLLPGSGNRCPATVTSSFFLLPKQPREHILDVDVHSCTPWLNDFKRGHGALADLHLH